MKKDIDEFYKEMENYASIIDNRILRFKGLTERHEASTVKFSLIEEQLKKNKNNKTLVELIGRHENEQELIDKKIEKLEQRLTEIMQLFKEINKTGKPAQTASTTEQYEKVTKAKQQSQIVEDAEKAQIRSHVSVTLKPENTNMESFLAEEILDILPKSSFKKQKHSIESRSIGTKATEASSLKKNISGEKTEDNLFIKLMSRIGNSIAPSITNSTAHEIPQGRPEDPNKFSKEIQTRLQREIAFEKTTLPVHNVEKPGIQLEQKKEPKPELETKKITLEKSVDDVLMQQLFEGLKDSRKRPHALKKLLESGFTLSDISETAGIPYSDLELTRSLYKI